MIVFLLIGSVIRSNYKRREVTDDKVFDFEKATREIVAENKIISEPLKEHDTFQLGDLLYHVHRINVIGNNNFYNPW